ncbi:MAG: ATP-binding protein [Oscillospiraceae bacterium]|nr:ATP-binding protein [Oscillospiraceae bacterium]
MALDGKILARAKATLEKRRREKEEQFETRLQGVYVKFPAVRLIDAELRATMAELVGVAVGTGASSLIDDIRSRNQKLQEERRGIINCAGFPEGYLDNEYICEKCHDTGFKDAKMCECLAAIYKQEQSASLSNLFKLGNETFETFNLSFYSDTPASDTGISPRQSMKVIYEICVEYARSFGSNSMNIFFNGAPGLGKTFLSACIARVVADNGFSVVYDMASSVFAKFEDAKFQRTDDLERLRNETNRYLECDLLIIDDLGTEMITAFTISTLYEIVNTRLVTGRKTIINSNLTLMELNKKYSEQIMSRLEGEYQVLTFYGDDIRKKRNSI